MARIHPEEKDRTMTDLVQAAVAAALREAAALFEQDALDMRAEGNTLYWTAENDAKRILALIKPDAQAALDRLVKERSDEVVAAAVAAALREAAGEAAGEIAALGERELSPFIRRRILALITPDAQAALDRVVAAERERCAKVAGDAWMDGVPIAEIPAIIRKGDTP